MLQQLKNMYLVSATDTLLTAVVKELYVKKKNKVTFIHVLFYLHLNKHFGICEVYRDLVSFIIHVLLNIKLMFYFVLNTALR